MMDAFLTGAGGTALLVALVVAARQITLAVLRSRATARARLAELEQSRTQAEAETTRARLDAEATGQHRRIEADQQTLDRVLPVVKEAWSGHVASLEQRLTRTEAAVKQCHEDREQDRVDRERERQERERERAEGRDREQRCEERFAAVAEVCDALLRDRQQPHPQQDRLRARLRASTAPEMPAARQTTILLVDDDAQVRRAMQRQIEQQEHRCIAAPSAVEALRVLGGHEHIDLVITDVRMPGLDGFDLLQRIRAHRSEVPVILVTGHPEDAHELARTSDAQLLTKPIDGAALAAAIREALT